LQAVSLPDGRLVAVKKRNVAPIRKRMTSVSARALTAEARKFLGVPYLWGGITSTGFDCSGLVQAVFATFGITMPRDTKDQIRSGTGVARDRIRMGDLLFFDRHVGIATGDSRIIHASRGGGGVTLNSLTPGEPDYRPDLAASFRQARRIL
jgi:cell wall-associated NlpC family hydrolase